MEEKIKKDVIYIDIEDDITDIVEKVKNSKEKIIAIVPPKSIGVLRSSVNLRLLAKTSTKVGKRIVIVTSNPSLVTMAGSASIPVAKTLQSKPEIPEIDVLEVDGEDVIDGEALPVAEFAGKSKDEKEAEMLDNLDIDDNKTFSKAKPEVKKDARKKSAIKVPNFNAFRKKIFIFGGLSLVLIASLVWAIVFAPAATVTISAKTSDLNISEKVSLSTSAAEIDSGKGILPLKTEVVEKVEEIKFEATGTKEDGEAASGTLTLSQSTESDPVTVKSGTAFSAGGCNFVTTGTATIPGARLRGGSVTAGSTSVNIRATQIGEQCNLPAQRYSSSVDGVSANGGQLSGGSKRTYKVVSENDVNAARQKLSEAKNDGVKNELLAKFDSNFKIIDESYAIETGEIELSPNVGQEAPNGAVAKIKSKYRISAISKNDIDQYLKNLTNSKIKADSKQIFGEGIKDFQITNFNSGESSANISATAKIGPKINESELKNQIKGKVFGEVQSKIEAIEGVRNVDVKFSYFWVSKIPNDDKKITIKFTVE